MIDMPGDDAAGDGGIADAPPEEPVEEVVQDDEALEAAEGGEVEEDPLQRVFNGLRGPNYLGRFEQGDDLDRVLLVIQEQIIIPDLVLDLGRATEFTRRYMPFGKANSDIGIVKTPEHIARLMCDLAGVNPHSRVLDITCGTGTFLAAAHDAMRATATPEQEVNLGRQLLGIDKDWSMWGTTLNQLSIIGAAQSNILNANCFDVDIVEADVAVFAPTITLFNPPHSDDPDLQPYRPLQFLKRACDLTAVGGTVVALMPLNSLVMKRGGRETIESDRTELLNAHRLVATMQLPQHIFTLLPKKAHTPNSIPVIVVMEAGVQHDMEGDEVWMSMWLRDGFRHLKNAGLVPDEQMERQGFTWESIRAQWRQSFSNRNIIPLKSIPWPGQEPPFGASHQRKIRIRRDDWIAVAEIPPPIAETEDFLIRVREIWADYVGYLRTMRRK